MAKTKLTRWEDIQKREFSQDSEARAEWERTALARAVAIAVISYRAEHGLSQRALASEMGVPQAFIGRLELGEHNPALETLYRLSAALGTEFILAVTPPNHEGCLALPFGARVLEDLTLETGGRVLIAMGS